MFPGLHERADYDVRVPARRNPHKPGIVFDLVGLASARQKLVARSLGASGFAGKIDPLEMSAGISPTRIEHFDHGICNGLPILGIDRKRLVSASRIRIEHRLLVIGWDLIGKDHMWPHERTARGNAGDRPHHLHRGRRNRALAYPH